MKKRIIHIAPDEKFIAATDLVFKQAFPHIENVFYIHTKNDKPLRHTKPQIGYHTISDNAKDLAKVVREIRTSDLVVLHYLLDFSCKLRLAVPPEITFMWILWGKDIFESHLYKDEIYGRVTAQKFAEKQYISKLKQLIKKTLTPFGVFYPQKKKEQAIERIQLIGCPFHEDFQMFYDLGILAPQAQPIRCFYYPLEFIFKDNMDRMTNGQNIQIGNSATATNNHIEIFDRLKKMNLDDRRLITPLSYGDKKYAAKIQEIATELFPENFHPLANFMPLAAYQKTMSSCSIVLMNHYRKQGTGNVISMMWMGAKIYLNHRSSLYQFLKRVNCHIYSIEDDLTSENKKALEALDKQEIKHNKEILMQHFSMNKILQTLRSDLSEFIDPSKGVF